jgi:uncharacterized membrane protein YdcZ (DUF606 family)
MNQASPATTGAVAVTGAMLGGVVVWICNAAHWPTPPVDVAGTLGALMLAGAHAIGNHFSKPEAPKQPAAPAAQP